MRHLADVLMALLAVSACLGGVVELLGQSYWSMDD